mmetsp:Transcript_5350/g.21913  ORF Transcript_5350/g.21913 Transcript_5350/m.21913 type:complete len:230 (+) Transcript_5350:679-1368(+)
MSSPHRIIASPTRSLTSLWSPRVSRTSRAAASALRTAVADCSHRFPPREPPASSPPSTNPSPSPTSNTRAVASGIRTSTAPRFRRSSRRRRAASTSSSSPSCRPGSSANILITSPSVAARVTRIVLVPTQYSSVAPRSSITAVTDTAHLGSPGVRDIRRAATGSGNMGRTPRGWYPLAPLDSASASSGVPSPTHRVASATWTHTRILPPGKASADTASSTSTVPSPSMA